MFAAFASFNFAAAQTESKMAVAPAQRIDTINAATKLERVTDVKSMEAVKTQEHAKVTPKEKDTVTTKMSTSSTKTKMKPKK